jgi:outer membrane protein assembly factor BamB
MSAKTGDKIWSVDLIQDFGARNLKWGMTENLVVEGEKLFCTVGGEDANIVAFNKNNGKVIWKSKAKGEISAYNSPNLIEHGGKKILVTQTQSSILGIDIETGELLWDFSYPNKYSVHANTPVYQDGMLLCVSGYGKGSIILKLADDSKSVTEVWKNDSLDSKMGGVILHNEIIYGSGDYNKRWFGIDWKTGKILFSNKMLKNGNLILSMVYFIVMTMVAQ